MKNQKWVSIFGRVEIRDAEISLIPQYVIPQEQISSVDGSSVPAPHAVVRSNLLFDQGVISWEAKLGNADARAQLLLALDPAPIGSDAVGLGTLYPELAVGLNVAGAPYGFAIMKGTWEGGGGAGHGVSLPVQVWIGQRLVVRGSEIDFYVDDVRVLSVSRTLKRGPIGIFLQGTAESSIRNVSIQTDAPTCFAVMQFTTEYNVLYQDVIKPICESYGYRVIRGDDFYSPGLIMEDVTQSIRSASLVIADVTPDNANVFYELGYAHAISKPTILLSDRRRERLPFDISGFRTLFYDNTIGGKAKVEERLKHHLDALRPK